MRRRGNRESQDTRQALEPAAGRTGPEERCDIDPPDAPNKQIRIGPDQSAEMEFIIHEAIHGAGWHIDEEFVAQFAEDVATILKRCGYRKV